jgi:hypothetical protein
MHKPYDNVTMLIFELKCIIEHSAANVYESYSSKECQDHIVEELECVLRDAKDTRKKLKYLSLSLENNLGSKTMSDLTKQLDTHINKVLCEVDNMHKAILTHGHDNFDVVLDLLERRRASIKDVFNNMVDDLKTHVAQEFADHLKLD